MQREIRIALVVGTAFLGMGCTPNPPKAKTPDAHAASQQAAPGAPTSPTPAWLVPYTPQQQALLKPVDRPIQTPANRVFPDLQRFWYANNRPLQDNDDALRFTKMVLTVLDDSPRFYVLGEAAPELANSVVQYGPPPPAEADGFQVVRRGKGDIGELVAAQINDAAKAAAARGDELTKKGDHAGAADAYREAAAQSPEVPAYRISLADALAQAGKLDEAAVAYQEAISADPTFAPAYIGLATLAEKREDMHAARKHLAEALAYSPNSPRAHALAEHFAAHGRRVPPFSIFLDVDQVGAIHAAAQTNAAAQLYAGCRAVMRFEPYVRSQIFNQPVETPYYLSVVEEVVCLEAALGAYLADREKNPDKPGEPNMDALLEMARAEGLSGYAMFEILGQHRPERARTAPTDVHRDMVRYVEQHVLGQSALPDSVYTVRLDRARDDRSL